MDKDNTPNANGTNQNLEFHLAKEHHFVEIQPPVMGVIFGKADAPTYIAGLAVTIVLLICMGVVHWFMLIRPTSVSEILDKVVPIGTLALGYLFGQHRPPYSGSN